MHLRPSARHTCHVQVESSTSAAFHVPSTSRVLFPLSSEKLDWLSKSFSIHLHEKVVHALDYLKSELNIIHRGMLLIHVVDLQLGIFFIKICRMLIVRKTATSFDIKLFDFGTITGLFPLSS